MLSKSRVPKGKSGDWAVEKFSVSAPAAKKFNNALRWSGSGITVHRRVKAGKYTRLVRQDDYDRTLVMSDTPAEIDDHKAAVAEAHGVCLVAGLGLGIVAEAMASKRNVDRVIVIERSPDVIKLVATHLRHRTKIDIVLADIHEWKPPRGQLYGVAWFDIWDTICSDNIKEMGRLTRRFARRAAWCGCWARYECDMAKGRNY